MPPPHVAAVLATLAGSRRRDTRAKLSQCGGLFVNVDVLQRLAPADRDLAAWHYARVLTIGTLLAFRTYELGFHGWDIRASVDPAAELRPDLRPFLVEFLRRFFVPLACHPDGNLRVHAVSKWTVRPGPTGWEEGGSKRPHRRQCQMPSSGRIRARISSSRPRAEPWPIAWIGS
jgi:hypothetical protein